MTGRKLLLADDSIAVQKVIDLTFTDEGMEVTTVGDGDDALEKLKQLTPDVVLADIYMPGADGYELCQFIKQNERFRGIPVMLLIGSFEPFDEAEAQRVGADDIVTKPFQSIRQLVSRVGSLLGDNEAAKKETAHKYSTLGLDPGEANAPADASALDEQPNVRVFVEAPVREESEAETAGEHHCPPNVELQTADTRELEPIEDAATEMSAVESDIDDTVEIEVLPVEEAASESANKPMMEEWTQTRVVAVPDDGVLDLGDVDTFVPAEDDFVLDLDVELVTPPRVLERVIDDEPEMEAEPVLASEAMPAVQAQMEELPTEAQEWEMVAPVAEVASEPESAASNQASPGNLSPEVIEAISRRVVEQLSEKVVREIAWEVVPELSELMIRKRLEEQK